MSHEVETMAYAGETPWHGLGTPVSNDLTPEQMLICAGLDWEVKKRPLYFRDGDKLVKDGEAEKLCRVRNGKLEPLSTVTSKWNEVQNAEGAEFFADFVRKGQMQMHTAGSLKGGRIVWFLAKLNDGFEAVKGDHIEGHMLFTIPHMYGKSTDVRFTPIRVVCNNTLTMALRRNAASNQMVAVNHRNPFDSEKVKEMLGIAHNHLETYKEQAAFLASKKLDSEAASIFFDAVFPRAKKAKGEDPTRQHDRAMSILETQPGAQFATGTWWQALNAVTFICDHEMGRDADKRLQSSWYGPNFGRKHEAMKLALEMANAA